MEDVLVKEIGMKPTKWKNDKCTEYEKEWVYISLSYLKNLISKIKIF